LLVVIAIIAILAAILFPVFAKAREKAYQTACVNHQRQLAIALMSAAQDNDETLPLPSEWVSATNMSSDAKIFNCPSVSHKGRPSDPDYGMNAFLYDVDSQTGGIVALALGRIENPAAIELTADKRVGFTPDSYGDPIKDQFMNPFPNSFTIDGYKGTGEARHSGGVVVSYVDGHVKLLKGIELGLGMTGYNIPANKGRCYIDFSTVKDEADAVARLNGGFTRDGFGGYSASNYGTFNAATKTYDLSPGDKLLCNGTAGESKDTEFWMTYGRKYATFFLDATMSDASGAFSFGLPHYAGGSWAYPAADPDNQNICFAKAFAIDKSNNRFQGGQVQCWSPYAYAGYAAGTYIDLPSDLAGTQAPISSSASHFIVELRSTYQVSGSVPWATERDKWWTLNNPYTPAYQVGYIAQNTADVTVTMPGADPLVASYEGPFYAETYSANFYGKGLWIHAGTMKINKILLVSYD
jgi:prepilin-type processing-associated H-X9-DG protein